MKNYSKFSKGAASSQLDSNQSLFMDDSTEDLENYLNTPSASTTVFEQDSECSTMNILSKNIKGKFRKSSYGSKKNKFFKSKMSYDETTAVSNEIPVINEAMKKIFKETSYNPESKQSPKLLKTYSNKNKDKCRVVESFGLPDEPFVSTDNAQAKEQNSIDLDFKDNYDCPNVSLLSNSGIPLNEEESTEFQVLQGFRRKPSFTLENVSYQEANLETEVREAFFFEEEGLLPEDIRQRFLNTERNLVVSIEHLDLDDIKVFENNALSPTKNKKELILKRLEQFTSESENSQIQKNRSNDKSKEVDTIKSDSRRSTRLNNSTSNSNCYEGPKPRNSISKLSNKNNESFNQKNKKDSEGQISVETPSVEIFSPRRSKRGVVESVVLSPLKKTGEKPTIQSKSASAEKTQIQENDFKDIPTKIEIKKIISNLKTRSSKKVETNQVVKTWNENTKNIKENDLDDSGKDVDYQEKIIPEKLLQEIASPPRHSNRLKKRCTILENQTVSNAMENVQLENDSKISNAPMKEQPDVLSPIRKRGRPRKLVPPNESKSKTSECSDLIQRSENEEVEFFKSPRKNSSVESHSNEIKNGKTESEIENVGSIPNSCIQEPSKRRSERIKIKHDKPLQEPMEMEDETSFQIRKPEEETVDKNNLNSEILMENDKQQQELTKQDVQLENDDIGNDEQTDIQTNLVDELQTKKAENEDNIFNSKCAPVDYSQTNENNIQTEKSKINITTKNNIEETDQSKSRKSDTTLRKSHRLLPRSDVISDKIEGNEILIHEVMKIDLSNTDESNSGTDEHLQQSTAVVISEDTKKTEAPIKRGRGRPRKIPHQLTDSLSLKSPENLNINEKLDERNQKNTVKNSSNSTEVLMTSPNPSNSCDKIDPIIDDFEREQNIETFCNKESSGKNVEVCRETIQVEPEEMKSNNNENKSLEEVKSNNIKNNDNKSLENDEQKDEINKDEEKNIIPGEKTEGKFNDLHKYNNELKIGEKMSVTQTESKSKATDEIKVNGVVDNEIKDVDREVISISKTPDSFSAKSANSENAKDSKTHLEYKDGKNGTKPYLDFGYDINRRTSFRKILEKVMEASRIEMEMKNSEALRYQRCKSVPHERFQTSRHDSENHLKAYSADSKLKFLKDKKNSFLKNVDTSKVRKRLSYDIEMNSVKKDVSMRKRTMSMHTKPINHRNPANDQLNTGNMKLSSENKSFGDKNNGQFTIGEMKTKPDDFHMNTNYNNNVSGNLTVDSVDAASSKLSNSSEISSEDLEVANLMMDKSDGELGRRRSKSLSVGRHKRKLSQSGISVSSKRAKIESHPTTINRADTPFLKTMKKVYDFKLGDIVWSKIGTYPYWPSLIVEDPETSEFKKFRLLRSTPYYHVRFFGDKGKRAWTIHCIPYEGPDDLDVLRAECRLQGHGSGEYKVKYVHKKKWDTAVKEADMLKNDPVEERLSFFEQILERSETPDNIKDEAKNTLVRSKSLINIIDIVKNQSTPNEKKQAAKIPLKASSSINECIESVIGKYSGDSEESEKDLISNPPSEKSEVSVSTDSSIRSPSKRRSNRVKDISVLSCIDHVVTEHCSPDGAKESAKRKAEVTLIEKGAMNHQTDFSLELSEITMDDVNINTQDISKNHNSPLNRMEINVTPTSGQKDIETSLRYTRSKSSLSLRKRRLTQEYWQDDKPKELPSEVAKEGIAASCSPQRMRLKRSNGVRQSNEDTPKDDGFLKQYISRLPEYKKNIFRGVPKERVCQICEKPGEVVKCRGPCNGDFHIQCIEKSLKETEKLTLTESELVLKDACNSVSLEDELFVNNEQVEISTVGSKKKFPDNVNLSPFNRQIPLMEQFDRKMKEMMNQVESRISNNLNGSSSEEIDVVEKPKATKNNNKGKNGTKRKSIFKHVTADDVSEIVLFDNSNSKSRSESLEQASNADEGVYKCSYCVTSLIPPCFVCNSVVSKKGNSMRQRCSLQKCGKYYHLECLNVWHQTQWSFILHDKRKTEALDSFVCPRHSCHICTSENSGFSMGRCPNDKLVKCLRCPATYHNSYHCVPAGTEILSSTQVICPKHVEGNKKSNTLNTIWCFVCSEGGNLICCETCPTSVHSECLPVNLLEDESYICEDCESGRFPLYDEVVWVKCGTFRWWPAVILFPSEIPPNVDCKPHSKGEFVVKFFGTYNYFWVGRGRTFLYQEGDTGCLNSTKNKIDEAFSRALREAADVYRYKKGLRAEKQKEVNNGLKPPPYVRIKVNRPVGNVKVFEGNLSNTTPCECDPKDRSPCGPNTNCLNRILLTECNPVICPAGQRCKNQCFEKREYPQLMPYRTMSRGWGLKTLEPIKKGRFVIEYVGEIIDDDEYQRRITRMHQQKDENYYFLTIDKDRMLDAGPKGNMARFMNHSCQPNCETQKWTVNGDTRVGLFAIEDIAVDSELTFNYNLECVGTEKKICSCGAQNCSGFIGVKPVNPEEQKSVKKSTSLRTVETEKSDDVIDKEICFVCGKNGDTGKCSTKTCLRSYHLECVQLDSWPNGKWSCPSHACNVCLRRTSRICVLCNNSYCPFHSDGNIRYDDSVGYLCSEHEQTKKKRNRRGRTLNGNSDSTSASEPGPSLQNGVEDDADFVSSRSARYKRRSCVEVDIPVKRRKLEK